DAGLEARAVARLEQRLTAVLDQGNLAFEHEDELVLLLVPVAQRRGGARLEPREIDAELGEPSDVAESRLLAAVGHFAPGLRVDPLGAHHGLGDVDLGHAHTRSMMVAVPMPAPMHSVTSAVSRLLRSSSSIAVPRIMAPVAPSGWPIAIAPPLTLTFLGSSLNACRKRSTSAAKASLTSIRSMFLSVILARLSTFSVTSIGPVSISAGSEPMLAKARILARGLSPAARPASLLPTSTAAAPSTMPDELPAWCTCSTNSISGCACIATASKPPSSPICTNDGLSWASDCILVSGRMCSSRARIVRPFTSFTGITDRPKRPSFQALAARCWLSTAYSSHCAREKPYLVAIRSAEMPCGMK